MPWARCVLPFLIAACQLLSAGDVEGSVIITRKLTRKRVTAPASTYARGVAVELRHESEEDMLDLERSRVVIYLEGRLPSRPVSAEIVQAGRQFVPDTVVVSAGSTVSFPNHDPIFHNVFSLSKPKSFDLGNYAKNQTRNETFSKPGVVLVHCHLHPNMSAAILVAPNGYTAIADKKGRFVIRDVPAGDYTAIAWHRAAGYFRRSVKVTADGSDNPQFVIPLEGSSSDKVLAKR